MVDTGGEGCCQAEEGTPAAADRYRQSEWIAAQMVAEAKTWVWEEFRDAMEKDFHIA